MAFFFSVESGQVVGLLKSNGAGKTTSFYTVVGLIQSDSGTINIDEANISKEPMYRRARVGLSYLAQEPSIFRKSNSRGKYHGGFRSPWIFRGATF